MSAAILVLLPHAFMVWPGTTSWKHFNYEWTGDLCR